jgi:iron(III) transport system substrate-binding protein
MELNMKAAALTVLFVIAGSSLATAAEINLYTTREAGLIEPLIKSYEAKTGVKINVVFMKGPVLLPTS